MFVIFLGSLYNTFENAQEIFCIVEYVGITTIMTLASHAKGVKKGQAPRKLQENIYDNLVISK